MNDLMYQCPHCHARAEVTVAEVGQVNECSACGRPYRPEVPIGRMMLQDADGEWAVVGETSSIQRSSGEKTIMTVRPAMFRANPLRYSAMVVAFVIGVAGVFIFGEPMQNIGLDKWWRPITLVLKDSLAKK